MKTTTSKLRVAILFGGKSAEHEISVLSAKSVVSALDRSLFDPRPIGIDVNGCWHGLDTPDALEHIIPKENMFGPNLGLLEDVDVVFPVLHGPMGEDGTMQGLLELMDLPYVGPNVLGSAVGMDKDVMKRLLRDAGISITPFLTVSSQTKLDTDSIVQTLGLPLFVKPANMGSSVGVSKVTKADDLVTAVDLAFRFDTKVLIETAIVGSEIECAVLGNEHPEASVLGRIIPRDSFYSYDAKYHDEDGTVLEIPARISADVAERARAVALSTFQTLGCEGMARIDMFASEDGRIIVNEINTIPGFTKFSMYPGLWEASGLPYPALITRLLRLAMERAEKRKALTASY
jgi:D-alanine-D-alanine ligase